MKNCANLMLILGFLLSTSTASIAPEIKSRPFSITSIERRWTGTLSLHEKMTWPEAGASSERRVDLSFTDALPTLYRDDPTTDLNFTDDKGTGTDIFRSETFKEGIRSTTTCNGTGPAQLHEVTIDTADKRYRIEAFGPPCVGTTVLSIPRLPTETTPYGPETTTIDAEREYGTDPGFNPKFLSGTETTTRPIEGTDAKVTRTVTWNLRSEPIDAELIVTPVDYDNWLPRPSRNELFKGSVMQISLRLQGRNGRAPSLRAARFELKLSNTSQEPGTTLNFPLQPSSNQLPDLRFVVAGNAESVAPDQSISINSPDGFTGQAYIGSYDGGGWSTLTAEAILQGGTRIKGSLLRPGGPQEILIPKRDVGEHIAASWLAANGNPAEMDDRDRSPGNANLGDGLTAYEEYRGFMGFKEDRGVFSGPEFIRLDPQKKELGVRMTFADLSLFAEGLLWFKNASGIKPIVFSEDDIGSDRRLNKNASNAHIYKQYVINLENADLPGDVVGENEPEDVKPMYPEKSLRVKIDKAAIDQSYQLQSSRLPANARMPYSAEEDLANTVAHELAHSVNVVHHGDSSVEPPRKAYSSSQPPFRIYWFDGSPEDDRPYPTDLNAFLENAGIIGNDSSGDLACIMAYTNRYNWAFMRSSDGALLYRKTRLLPVGKTFCIKVKGTEMNECRPAPPNARNPKFYECPMYFGDARYGNCLSQFKLKP
jgi:hypothetical protein